MEATEANRSLGALGIGQRGRVRNVSVVESLGQRLLELGLLPGIDIALVQVAPLGDPIAVEFQGRRVSLRRSEAMGITLE
jgi:Fe2+ transport system protein FeoA